MARDRLQGAALWDALFDVAAPTELERACQPEPMRLRVGQMGYVTRTIRSGPVTECEVYPVWGRKQAASVRRARERVSTERVQRANQAAAIRRVIRLANTNFSADDLHVTLTYEGNPPDYAQAQRDVRNFIRRLQRLREKRGLEKAKYIYAIEDQEDGVRKRIHAHMLLSGGISREEIEACWRKGWANADRLQPNAEGLAAIARYITKSQKNRKKWVCSQGLKQPRITTSLTKLSTRKVERLASELETDWKDVLRKTYPGLEPVRCEVWGSDLVPGVFVRCQMIRWGEGTRP